MTESQANHSFLTEELRSTLRELAREQRSVVQLIDVMTNQFSVPRARITVAIALRFAFSIPTAHLGEICGWSGLGGSRSDDEIESVLQPLIQSEVANDP